MQTLTSCESDMHPVCMHPHRGCSRGSPLVLCSDAPNACALLPCRQLLAVADSLSSLAVAASRALSSGAPPPWLGAQFQAGCRTLAACSNIANKLEHLTAASAFKIAAVCGLVFGPGTVLLQQMQRETAAAATPTAREVLSAMCNAQLAAVSFCMDDTLQTPIQPAAVAAFAGSTGKPTALLPWLLAVARVLTTIGASVAAGGSSLHGLELTDHRSSALLHMAATLHGEPAVAHACLAAHACHTA